MRDNVIEKVKEKLDIKERNLYNELVKGGIDRRVSVRVGLSFTTISLPIYLERDIRNLLDILLEIVGNTDLRVMIYRKNDLMMFKHKTKLEFDDDVKKREDDAFHF